MCWEEKSQFNIFFFFVFISKIILKSGLFYTRARKIVLNTLPSRYGWHCRYQSKPYRPPVARTNGTYLLVAVTTIFVFKHNTGWYRNGKKKIGIPPYYIGNEDVVFFFFIQIFKARNDQRNNETYPFGLRREKKKNVFISSESSTKR